MVGADGALLGGRTRVVPGGREAAKAARKEAKKRAKSEFKRSHPSSSIQERRSRMQDEVHDNKSVVVCANSVGVAFGRCVIESLPSVFVSINMTRSCSELVGVNFGPAVQEWVGGAVVDFVVWCVRKGRAQR